MNASNLTQMLQRLADTQEIANLQGRYMYYMQSHDYEQILQMFAQRDPDVSAEIAESGVYVGPEKIRALFMDLLRPFFTSAGALPVHMLTSPVIEVATSGTVAYGMWQTLGCNTFPTKQGPCATWQQGKYDNIFVKEDGQWRFRQFRWLCNFRTAFDQGWVKQALLPVEPLDLRRFPAALHPTKPGVPFKPYNPSEVMDFGPLPPPPTV